MHTLENNTPLSKSFIWEELKRAYQSLGIDAWVKSGVPFYITCNPFIAKCYAQVALSYLKDIGEQKQLNVLELGAGSGRLAHHFLRKWLEMNRISGGTLPQLHYEMTDVSQKNIAFWRQHPCLIPHFENKILNASLFDPLRDSTLPGSSPHIVIANYLFDTLPQDLFYYDGEELKEGLITIKSTATLSEIRSDPSFLDKIEASYRFETVNSPSYYAKWPAAQSVLNLYLDSGQKGHFMLPVGAFQLLQTLSQKIKNLFTLLAGDRGKNATSVQFYEDPPGFARHGTLSYDVDFWALAHFTKALGEMALLPSLPRTHFITSAFCFGKQSDSLFETFLAYKEQVDAFDPEDQWKLARLWEQDSLHLSLEQFLLLLKNSQWDLIDFHYLFNRLQHPLGDFNEQERWLLCQAMDALCKSYYPLSQKESFLFCKMGWLLLVANEINLSYQCFEKAEWIDARNPMIEFGKKICANAQITAEVPQQALDMMRQLLQSV